ncbi:MAG: DUF262 domain-containing protein [bacterium]|nr:DUF262 domain-containing protein [bacterium]
MNLVEDIDRGRIALPDIQRPFVWKPVQVRDLFDSMYRGFPVGTLMFWETGAEAGIRQIGGGDGDGVPRLLIVDGQQRLTSLYSVLQGKPVLDARFKQKRIKIAFRPEDESFEVSDAAIRRDPEYIADVTALWGDRYRSVVREFLARLAAHRQAGSELPEPNWDALHDRLEDRIDRVRDLRDFQFQALELTGNADEEQVADIFVRANSKGVQLKQADFILTLMSVHWEKGRVQIEQFCRDAVAPAGSGASPRNPFIDPKPDQMLRVAVGLAFRRARLEHVYRLLLGKDLRTGDVSAQRRTEQFERLQGALDQVLDLGNWHEFLKCLTHAGFRSGQMVISESAVLFSYLLWLIGRCDFGLDRRRLRGVMSRWFFMAHTTGRYTGATEGLVEGDLRRLEAAASDGESFCAELDRIIRATFTRDYWEISLPERLDTSSSRSPVLSAYLAALNLLDAEALLSNLRIRDLSDPLRAAPRSLERHHLFPKAHLAAKGITRLQETNAIANMAFLDWPDNAAVGPEDPRAYWPAMSAAMDPARLERQMYWHALPVGWEQLDYPTFLARRRRLLAMVVRDGVEQLWDAESSAPPAGGVDELLKLGESQTLEFKSSARWNSHTGGVDKRLEHVVVKTVCGFLNAAGGKLLIGVKDDAEVLGVDADMETLGRKADKDGYELFLRQLLENSLSVPTAGIVHIGFEHIGGVEICVVTVASSGKPVFAKPLEGGAGHIEFWLRVGNATRQLHGDDMLDYKNSHWGD